MISCQVNFQVPTRKKENKKKKKKTCCKLKIDSNKFERRKNVTIEKNLLAVVRAVSSQRQLVYELEF